MKAQFCNLVLNDSVLELNQMRQEFQEYHTR
jgi:hypothetical protein